MDNEKILLENLNKFGNFTDVSEEFNEDQLDAIYGSMNRVKNNGVLADIRLSLPLSYLIERESYKAYPIDRNRYMNAQHRQKWIEGAKWIRTYLLSNEPNAMAKQRDF